MIDKLALPFPLLSDPDRTLAIEAFGVADPQDARHISRPAMVLVDRQGDEVWRFVSRDFADRLPEEDALAQVEALGLEPTSQDSPAPGDADPGPRAIALDALPYYLRGARFAALAMGLRHGHHDESVKDDSKAYVAEMDRFHEAVQELRKRSG
jgi:hypothetical protein